MATLRHHPSSDGWVLYYDDQGYAYYHNPMSGESVWAIGEEDAPVIPLLREAHPPPQKETRVHHDDTAVVAQSCDAPTQDGEEQQLGDEHVENAADMRDLETANNTDEGDDNDDDDEGDTDEDLLEDDEEDDPEFEAKFSAMLATPEGQAALHAEMTRVDRALERRRQRDYEKWMKRNGQMANNARGNGASFVRTLVLVPLSLPLRACEAE